MMSVGPVRLIEWDVIDDTGSSVSINDTINSVTITTATDSPADRGYIEKKIPAQPGETLVVSFKAKASSGSAVGGIDYPTRASLKNSRVINSEFWQQYDLSYTASDTGDGDAYFQVVLGQITGYSGTVSISDVVIRVERSKLPVARCYCAGLLTINDSAGSVEVNPNFANIGLDKGYLSGQAVGISVNIKVPPTQGGSTAEAAPIFQASMTFDNPNVFQVMVRPGSYNRATGVLTLAFIDSTTGGYINISTLGKCYVWVMGFGV